MSGNPNHNQINMKNYFFFGCEQPAAIIYADQAV